MDKKKLSETDIRTKFITPAIIASGWDKHFHFREEFTAGKIKVTNNKAIREPSKKLDYLLFYKPHLPIAIIEAKDNKHSLGQGMQQALNYADILLGNQIDVPFVYSSNGDGFLEHDRTTGKEQQLQLNEFPTPEDLWARYKDYKSIDTEIKEHVATLPYFTDNSAYKPRYYQRIAINKTIDAIINNHKNRVLLVMATGTGKTYTAFQIIYKLYKAKYKIRTSTSKSTRILFLADRNILIDQTKTGDFKHFGDKMTKITNRVVNKENEIFLGLYQQLTGGEQNLYTQFSPDFFDLIVVDECHRGSAKADSGWRDILEYFTSATQIGLTATPKETKNVSNSDYFGDAVYTYSLKQGIDDGFLAPYKVIRFSIDKDIDGYRPESGKVDKYGNPIEDRVYNLKDFDRNIVLEKRTIKVAESITEHLKATDRFAKTIVFCLDTEHAERMRSSLVNANSDLVKENSKYIVRITGNDDEGKLLIDDFMHPEKCPIIATTSKLLTTGVDTKTVKNIVLDTNITSIIEFKQIIGRGTRIEEEYGKTFFTILDFKSVTKLFADPEFDGDPISIYDPESSIISETSTNSLNYDEKPLNHEDELESVPNKYYVNDVDVKIINKTVQYMDASGKLITQSLTDYTKSNILKKFATLDTFLQYWNHADKKRVIIDELEQNGVIFEELEKLVGREYDPFDLILHIAFNKPPLTRRDRANKVKKRDYFSKYGAMALDVIDALLQKYQDVGILDLDNLEVLKIPPLDQFGTPIEIVKIFGGKNQFIHAVNEMKKIIYDEVA
jgi:type I restriction enzyme R subunit